MASPFDCQASAAARNATLGPLEIDYLYLHYCVFTGMPAVSFSLLLLWLGALFVFLGSTADGYFSPTLASISEKLHVPYDVAGVTFLAFGNGAPDVFASIAAYSSGVGEAGINELLGGAMFISTVVVGCVAMTSAVDVQRWPFTRDVTALVMALLLLVALASMDAPATLRAAPADFMQLSLLAVYLVYVSSVLLPECTARPRNSKAARTGEPANGVLAAFWHALSPHRATSSPSTSATAADGSKPYLFVTRHEAASLIDAGAFELGSPVRTAPAFASSVIDDHFADDPDSFTSPLISDADRALEMNGGSALVGGMKRGQFSRGGSVLEGAYWRHLRWRWSLRRRIMHVYGGSTNLCVKLGSLPAILLVLARDVTIPLVDADAWSRSMAMLSPIAVPQLVLLSMSDLLVRIGPWHTPLYVLALAVGLVAALVVAYTTHRTRPPTSFAYSLFFLVLAFVACVCWIYMVANELVALLVAVGTLTHVSNSLLGMTVLSWGNCVGDLITNVSVARAGFPEMAIAGCFGGPVFNILLGLGIPMAGAFFRGEALALALDTHAWVSLAFLGASLALSYLVFRSHGFHCPAWYGKLLVVVYAAYTVLNVVIAVHSSYGG